jgi:1-acyl-sn-glycerol-3-phosphate acyltransferase
MILLKRFYTIWCIFWFLIVFLLLYPFFLLFLINKKTYFLAHSLNKVWAYAVFFITMVPWKIEWHYKPKKNQPVIFAPNHGSYLDIPSLCLTAPFYFVFVGKSSLGKVPLFGYMFKKLYISLDRRNGRSRLKAMEKAFWHIDQGRSIAIFPEGTIPQSNRPNLINFKDGPFRIAIEKQIPIVPVTIINNWKILPDSGKSVAINWHKMKMVYHKPIITKGMTMADLVTLKQMTFDIIQNELKKHHPSLVASDNICNIDNLTNTKNS